MVNLDGIEIELRMGADQYQDTIVRFLWAEDDYSRSSNFCIAARLCEMALVVQTGVLYHLR